MINRKNWKQQERNKKNKGKWLSGSALKCEVLGSHHFHLYNKKKLNQLKLNDLSWTHQRNVFAEKTGSHKSVEIGASREYLPEICLPAAEANEVINVYNNFDKLLEAECGGHSLGRGPYPFIIIYGSSRVLMVKSQEKSLYGSGRGRDGVNIVKYAQSIFHNKAHSPEEKGFTRAYPAWYKERAFLPLQALRLLTSFKGGGREN